MYPKLHWGIQPRTAWWICHFPASTKQAAVSPPMRFSLLGSSLYLTVSNQFFRELCLLPWTSTELCLGGRPLNWIEGYYKKQLTVLITDSPEHINRYITYYTLLEAPGEKVPSAPNNKNKTNLLIAHAHCELCNRQGFLHILLVANSYRIIFGAQVFIICTLSLILVILKSLVLFPSILLLLILTYTIFLCIMQVTLNPFCNKTGVPK